MTGNLQPLIHQWYQSVDGNSYFEIVAIDDSAATIEVQFIDGSVDEFDLDSWRELELILAFPPEDANAAFEGFPDQDQEEFTSFSIDSLEPDSFKGSEAE